MRVTVKICYLFHRELMKAYPNAKVLLTVRDNAEGWHKSVKETIYKAIEMNSGTIFLLTSTARDRSSIKLFMHNTCTVD